MAKTKTKGSPKRKTSGKRSKRRTSSPKRKTSAKRSQKTSSKRKTSAKRKTIKQLNEMSKDVGLNFGFGTVPMTDNSTQMHRYSPLNSDLSRYNLENVIFGRDHHDTNTLIRSLPDDSENSKYLRDILKKSSQLENATATEYVKSWQDGNLDRQFGGNYNQAFLDIFDNSQNLLLNGNPFNLR